jgi:hypothetical protein
MDVRLLVRRGTCQNAGVQFALYQQKAHTHKRAKREKAVRKRACDYTASGGGGGLIGLLIIHNSAESGQLPAMMN